MKVKDVSITGLHTKKVVGELIANYSHIQM